MHHALPDKPTLNALLPGGSIPVDAAPLDAASLDVGAEQETSGSQTSGTQASSAQTSSDRAERVTVVMAADWPVVGCGYRPEDAAAVFHANRVIACSPAARLEGVQVGLRRREAQRRAPALIVAAPDPAAEARLFERVVAALDAITPRIEIDLPGQCSFATRGPSRYFGGDQAMSERVAQSVSEALDGVTTVQVGTADSRFAALRAAESAQPGGVRVIAAGESAAFLSELPVNRLVDLKGELLASGSGSKDSLADLLVRLGILTLGAFAQLSAADVLGRFGEVGRRAHVWAQGLDDVPASRQDPPADLEVATELDPPVDRVDQAAFVAKALADEFCRALGDRGIGCLRVAIAAETEHGEESVRLWRADEAFSPAALAARTRWQLEGWLNAPANDRPTSGITRLALRPDGVCPAKGRQLGFWGEQTEVAERAARAVARVQGLVGPDAVRVPEIRGGRSSEQEVIAVPAVGVDLVGRDNARGVDEIVDAPWPGRLPPPPPARIHPNPIAIEVRDEAGDVVEVGGRGLISSAPATMVGDSGRRVTIASWAGPWLVDERWWDRARRRRRARFQVVTDDGRAHLVICEQGRWSIVATYD